MKQTVYIETSVISYFTAKTSRDLIIAEKQRITNDWWKNIANYEAYISSIVLEEISKGDYQAAQLRLQNISTFSVLKIVQEVYKLADSYFLETDIPEKARADSYHIAIASWYNIDFLLSWNCTHIVSDKTKRIIEKINLLNGIRTPVICTPKEFEEI
jgi:hypothetical protein